MAVTDVDAQRRRQLRSLPSVDQGLKRDCVQQLLRRWPRPQVVAWLRAALAETRQRILSSDETAQGDDPAVGDWIDSALLRRADAERGTAIQNVINATGVLLHTNLGRAPLADRAREAMLQAAGAANVELDLTDGQRCKRGVRVSRLLSQLTGAEDGIVVNNCAAATLLALQATAFGKEVLISRSQLVEIGGGFRLPEVFQSAGCLLREVGTTNRTYLRDYDSNVGEETGAILRVHRSNFRQSGFVTEPTVAELASAARSHHLPLLDDIGSGAVHDLSPWGFEEPTVQSSVRDGADLTMFSGDKLFGGPQCGMIVGTKAAIEPLRNSPMMRAIRLDKMALAALEATLELHLSSTPFETIPVLRMLAEPADHVQAACRTVAETIRANAAHQASSWTVDVAEHNGAVGGGTLPDLALPSYAVRVQTSDIDGFAKHLRMGPVPIQPRVADDAVWLDLRTVTEQQRGLLADLVVAAIARASGS